MSATSFLLAAILVAPVGAALSVPPLGESPPDWACDHQERVCVGITVGGSVSCSLLANASAACTYSYGKLARAWGPSGEPGIAGDQADLLITLCSSMRGCDTIADTALSGGCSWFPLLDCLTSAEGNGARTTQPLAMGECVTLRVRLDGLAMAQVHGMLAPIEIDESTAWHEDASDDGAQVCLLDDGR